MTATPKTWLVGDESNGYRLAKAAPAQFLRAKAPLRISFAGGGTDVPPFPEREGGVVLSATINRFAYGTLCPRPDDHRVPPRRPLPAPEKKDLERFARPGTRC